jgi:hypothetical protein
MAQGDRTALALDILLLLFTRVYIPLEHGKIIW